MRTYEKGFELFSRTAVSQAQHNKQEKTKHCLLEQFYKSFFSFPKVPNRTVIKEMHKILIWIHLLKPTSWTDFSEGRDEIRFEFRVRLQNLKSLFLMQSNAVSIVTMNCISFLKEKSMTKKLTRRFDDSMSSLSNAQKINMNW